MVELRQDYGRIKTKNNFIKEENVYYPEVNNIWFLMKYFLGTKNMWCSKTPSAIQRYLGINCTRTQWHAHLSAQEGGTREHNQTGLLVNVPVKGPGCSAACMQYTHSHKTKPPQELFIKGWTEIRKVIFHINKLCFFSPETHAHLEGFKGYLLTPLLLKSGEQSYWRGGYAPSYAEK